MDPIHLKHFHILILVYSLNQQHEKYHTGKLIKPWNIKTTFQQMVYVLSVVLKQVVRALCALQNHNLRIKVVFLFRSFMSLIVNSLYNEILPGENYLSMQDIYFTVNCIFMKVHN